jgi:hypothetical protein
MPSSDACPDAHAVTLKTGGTRGKTVNDAVVLDGSAALSQWSGLPRPTTYGVYAISNGRLTELDVLPIRVPDSKVRVSAPINKQSGTILPDGRIVFIVFRRDFTNSALERISIRVVARVVRALSFDPQGKGTNSSLEDMWTIRNISYDFRVAPLVENGEMFVIRPEDANFSFPAGRYALALKGQAYDFTVAGVVTETAQCIERVEAVNGTFYAECRRQ